MLVSEVMLQQTPVARVAPAWQEWLARWPSPGALAASDPGEAVRAWGRLGYPRRALRLHAAASAIVERYGGEVPDDLDALRALPGVGEYTAAAVASFAFGQRHVVLDTNVRRVLARLEAGSERPPVSLTTAERVRAAGWVPEAAADAAVWAVAAMEFGALVCTAASPRCDGCPVADACAWLAAGRPPSPTPGRRQDYEGTDRHCRGVLLGVLRAASGPVPRADVLAAWEGDPDQARAALASLLDDGLAHAASGDTLRL